LVEINPLVVFEAQEAPLEDVKCPFCGSTLTPMNPVLLQASRNTPIHDQIRLLCLECTKRNAASKQKQAARRVCTEC
jgi:DNA-directed RNA polymerase subunit RPC12/RpoP